jgi:tetratricopeptide (TPR) repeat protein
MSKSRRISIFAAVLAAAALPAAVPAAPRAESPERQAERVLEIREAYERKDCDSVLRLAPPIVDRTPSGLPEEMEMAVHETVILCKVDKDSKADAYAHALRVTGLEYSSDWLWRFRLALEMDQGKWDSAVATVAAMSQGRGAALNAIPTDFMFRLEDGVADTGRRDLRKRLLALLASDSYDPDDLTLPSDGFRLIYARMLAADGDSEGARRIVTGLRDPSQIAAASLDPALRHFLPAEVDIRGAAESALAAHREAMARQPDMLAPMLDAVMNLRQLGRAEEALGLLQAAGKKLDEAAARRARAESAGGNAAEALEDPLMQDEAFADEFERLPWFWDAYAKTYEMLGRYDDAVRAYGRGGEAEESGALNVSQLLNLADMQVRFNRPEDALRTLAVFDDPKRERSPYGEMVLRYVRGCAHAFAGRPAEAAADLAFAKAHVEDHPGAHSHLLLCTGDMDGAAAAVIKRLDDPDGRAAMLLKLSDYDDPPANVPPDPMTPRYKALKARPDVKAAILRAGGIRRFRVQAGEI